MSKTCESFNLWVLSSRYTRRYLGYSNFLWFLFTLLITLFQKGNPLVLRELDMSGAVENGTSIWLYCNYNIEAPRIYSVKWYRNDLEFFRCTVPSEPQKLEKKFFAQPGINVDLIQSNSTHIFLKDVEPETEGTFACEVSIMEASFESVKTAEDLRVYILPKEKMKLLGQKASYKAGDLVNISCVSGFSRPPTILGWFVNGNRIWNSEHNLNLSWNVIYRESDGLSQSFLNISFYIPSDKNIANKPLILRCASIISQITGESFEEWVFRRDELSRGAINSTSSRNPKLEPPTIFSVSDSRYAIGEQLNLGCSTPRLMPPPDLRWLVNNREAPRSNLSVPNPSLIVQKAKNFTSSIYDHFAVFEESGVSSTLNLHLRVTEKLFQLIDSTMRLRCVATHAKIIHKDKIGLTLFSDGRTSSYLFSSDLVSENESSTLKMRLLVGLFSILWTLLMS